MGLFSKKIHHHGAGQVDMSRLPRHIAIIMDGNGRWAKQRGLPRTAGHKVGAETFRKIALYCKALGVEYLTIYAFSTENWKRPAEEVSTLMSLLKKYMQEAIDTMERDQMKLRFFGDLSALSPELQALAHKANEVADRIHIHRLSRRLAVVRPGDCTMSDVVAFMTGAAVPPPDLSAA